MPLAEVGTSLVDIRPRNSADAVKYRPCRGSAAHIMFLASHLLTQKDADTQSPGVSSCLLQQLREAMHL